MNYGVFVGGLCVLTGLGVFVGAGGLVGTTVAGGLVGGGDVGATVGGGEVGGGDVGAVLGINVGCWVAEVPDPGLPGDFSVGVVPFPNRLVGDGDNVRVGVGVWESSLANNAGAPGIFVWEATSVAKSVEAPPGGARRTEEVEDACCCSSRIFCAYPIPNTSVEITTTITKDNRVASARFWEKKGK